jgi:hypothetical protein
MKGSAMAKKKKAAAKTKTKKVNVDLTSQKTISVIVPDSIGALHEDTLKSLAHVVGHAGELSLNAPPHTKVPHIAIIKTSQVAPQIKNFPKAWQKSLPDGC